MSRLGRISTNALAILLIAGSAAAQDGLPAFGADDVFELEYASDPRISPDGERIVYERRSNDIMTDRTRSNLWVVDADGRSHRPVVSGAVQASSPRWSPAGDRLAWFQSAETGTDILVRWMDDGQTARIASLLDGPSELAWSPDGRWLAFQMSVEA